MGLVERIEVRLDRGRGNTIGGDDHHSDAHVQRTIRLGVFEVPELDEHPEQRRHRPRIQVDFERTTVRQDARNVVDEASTRDVREALDVARFEQSVERRQITLVRCEQRFAD